MNADLLNPFEEVIPSEVSFTLEEEAHLCRFNPSGFFAGALLAVGRSDGWVTIWDVETKMAAWAQRAHQCQIESLRYVSEEMMISREGRTESSS